MQFVFLVDMADFFVEFPGAELTLDIEYDSAQLLSFWDLYGFSVWIGLSLCLTCSSIRPNLIVLRPLSRQDCTENEPLNEFSLPD